MNLWKYSKTYKTIEYTVSRGYKYWIRLDDLKTKDELEIWYNHLKQKTWATPMVLYSFLETVKRHNPSVRDFV